MTGRTYYNEFDPVAAHVLRELIKRGVIAGGDVDERSITDVHPDDVKGYTQCHWFAGGGLWSVACRLGGWSDERSIWTASLPCQPFSQAGQRRGEDDPRHLWPHFYRIVRARRPTVIVGEQVAGKAGYGWFDGVRASLAGENYACRSIDFPSCAVNAPHQRNRQYWAAVNMANSESRECRSGHSEISTQQNRPVDPNINVFGTMADSERVGSGRNESVGEPKERTVNRRVDAWGRPIKSVCEYFSACHDPNRCDGQFKTCPFRDEPPSGYTWSDDDGWVMADSEGNGREQRRSERETRVGFRTITNHDLFGPLDHAIGTGLQGLGGHGDTSGRTIEDRSITASDDRDMADSDQSFGWIGNEQSAGKFAFDESNVGNDLRSGSRDESNYWHNAEWIICHDGKARRTEPGIRFLVNGLPGRVDLWRIGGNAINPQAAAVVIEALRETLDNDDA